MLNQGFTLIGSMDFRCLYCLKGECCAVFNINYSDGSNFNTGFYSLSLPAPETANMCSFLSTLRQVRGIKGKYSLTGTMLLNKILIKRGPIKRLAHLVPISLFGIRTISCHIDKVIFAAKSHVKDQKVKNKFVPGFGCVINLCYYCIDKAFSLVEKHHGLWFSNTTKQMLFSFGFSPSGWFLRTGHC